MGLLHHRVRAFIILMDTAKLSSEKVEPFTSPSNSLAPMFKCLVPSFKNKAWVSFITVSLT